MTVRHYANNAQMMSLLSDISDSAVTLTVGSTASYPATPFTLVLERGSANQEVVLCTVKLSGSFTVTRGYDGTTAVPHATGTSVEHTVAALDYAEANAHANTPHFSASLVDAKGDLFVGTANDTVDRLAVGTDGYSMVPEATDSKGLRWEKSRGTIVCTSSTRPTLGLYEGVRIYETDTKLFYVRLASAWMPEPGQLLGITKTATSSGFNAGNTQRLSLTFTMPTLTTGRRVKITAATYFFNLAAALTGQYYAYSIVAKSGGVGIGGTLSSGYLASANAIGVPPAIATVDNTDIAAGATTVYYYTMVINAASTQLSHQMACDATVPAYLEAMIV